jgi:hypothetical protein
MKNTLRHFCRAESGSVTTDWIVLVASLVLLSFLVTQVIFNGAQDVSSEINTSIGTVG